MPLRLQEYVNREWDIAKIAFWSLFYNAFTNRNTVIDLAMEPIFWFVDHFAKYLGPAMVFMVICLTLSVVIIFYLIIMPFTMLQSFYLTCFHLVFGHWLLLMIVFNYLMGVLTHPGRPPPGEIPEVVTICKKCIAPKPPRTHHCSVCNYCVLKMDHHCPWVNNCIGHYNHRYFFMFCIYMWAGTLYVVITTYPLFHDQFFRNEPQFQPLKFWIVNLSLDVSLIEPYLAEPSDPQFSTSFSGDPSEKPFLKKLTYNCVVYEFLVCGGVFIALGLLILWHYKLIDNGETSIEHHINKSEAERLEKEGKVFHNPYYYGKKETWRIFFGLEEGRTVWRHLLLPSMHKPGGDGLSWETSTYSLDCSISKDPKNL